MTTIRVTSPFDSSRAIITVSGDDAVHFLQGILTQDITRLAAERIQFAALLSPQGKILHDMFVIDGNAIGAGDAILLDTPAVHKDVLLKRLTMYKLRAKVTLADVTAQWPVQYARDGGLTDPRHPQLPQRVYGVLASGSTPLSSTIPATEYATKTLALGIPDSMRDFAADEIVALDAGYDLLHAVSFTKGCYVGQEVTARMHYKSIARKGFFLLTRDGEPSQLVLLKFDEVGAPHATITHNCTSYTATLPEWMQPKWAQYIANHTPQGTEKP